MKFSSPVGSVEGYTLVLPAVSIGNIGQLSVDILLSSVAACKVADLFDVALVPVVAADPLHLNSDDLMTACQVFKLDSQKLVIFQLRSAIAKSKEATFLSSLLDWCKANGIASIVLLSSVSATERVDSQLRGAPLRYLTNQNKETFSQLSWIELESKTEFPSLAPGQTLGPGDELPLQGGGFTKSLHLKCLEVNFPLTILVSFASEGDNSRDALFLVEYYNQWADLFPRGSAKFPASWTHLFGNPAPDSIY